MTTATAEHTQMILQGAQNILASLGACTGLSSKLELSGRSPNLPTVSLQHLLEAEMHDGMSPSARLRTSVVLDRHLSRLRGRFMTRYHELSEQLYSTAYIGLSDADVEHDLLQAFESRYNVYLADLRKMLARVLRCHRSDADHRNSRGGFGDVSPPHHSS